MPLLLLLAVVHLVRCEWTEVGNNAGILESSPETQDHQTHVPTLANATLMESGAAIEVGVKSTTRIAKTASIVYTFCSDPGFTTVSYMSFGNSYDGDCVMSDSGANQGVQEWFYPSDSFSDGTVSVEFLQEGYKRDLNLFGRVSDMSSWESNEGGCRSTDGYYCKYLTKSTSSSYIIVGECISGSENALTTGSEFSLTVAGNWYTLSYTLDGSSIS